MSEKGVPNEYSIVRTLIRDLHITRNVSRPASNGKLLKKPKSVRKGVIPKVHAGAADRSSALRKSFRSSAIDEDDTNEEDDGEVSVTELDEGDEGRRSRSVPIMQPKGARAIDKRSTHQSSASFNVPSLVVTGPVEPIDIISSTQRRFSQLYSGLRRFSVSHTVRVCRAFEFSI